MNATLARARFRYAFGFYRRAGYGVIESVWFAVGYARGWRR